LEEGLGCPSEKGQGKLGTVAHACNPSYSGDRDQEDHGSKPALGRELTRPYLENTQQKKG
jgi:hypothetical protein